MQIKQGMENNWNNIVQQSDDIYTDDIIAYIKKWTTLLERKINASPNMTPTEVIHEFAEPYAHLANDNSIHGLTGLMYTYACSIIAQLWIYGDILKEWHNSKYNYNGTDGIINIAFFSLPTN